MPRRIPPPPPPVGIPEDEPFDPTLFPPDLPVDVEAPGEGGGEGDFGEGIPPPPAPPKEGGQLAEGGQPVTIYVDVLLDCDPSPKRGRDRQAWWVSILVQATTLWTIAEIEADALQQATDMIDQNCEEGGNVLTAVIRGPIYYEYETGI